MSWIDLRTKAKDLVKYINNGNCKTVVVFEDVLPLLQSIIDETDIERVIISSPKDYLSPIVKVLANIKDMKEGKKKYTPNDPRFIRFNDFIKDIKEVNVAQVKFERDRPSLIVQSSGSTGKPKQIVHTEYNFNSAVQKMAYTDLPFYKGNTMHISIPPFIIYGLGNSIYGSLAFTMKAEMNPYVDANTVYNDLGKFEVKKEAMDKFRNIIKKRCSKRYKLWQEYYKAFKKKDVKEIQEMINFLERKYLRVILRPFEIDRLDVSFFIFSPFVSPVFFVFNGLISPSSNK